MKVYPIPGRPICYYADSRSGGEQHFVNLTDHQGSGSCTCFDWSCRCVANMKKPHSLLSNEVMCEHIRAAHLHLLQGILEEILSK